jgi:hypothetical protein
MGYEYLLWLILGKQPIMIHGRRVWFQVSRRKTLEFYWYELLHFNMRQFGLLDFAVNLQLYAFPIFIVYILFWKPFGLIYHNPLLARFGFWHTLIVLELLCFLTMTRKRMPHSWLSIPQTMLISLWILATGEGYFNIWLVIYHPENFNTNQLLWVASLTVILISLGFYGTIQAFKLKPMMITALIESVFMAAWAIMGFHISYCLCSYGYKYFTDNFVNLLEILQWYIWITGFAIALKDPESLMKLFAGRKRK